MRREGKIAAIIDAERNNGFGEGFWNIETLSYTDNEGNLWTDRFDHVSVDGQVHFICGTGYPDIAVPLERLTDASIDKLYSTII